jgi:Fur family iron response transcriptional regulator
MDPRLTGAKPGDEWLFCEYGRYPAEKSGEFCHARAGRDSGSRLDDAIRYLLVLAMAEPGITREGAAALLSAHGVNPTRQRVEIAHVLFERGEHLSADQILALVNARHARASKATVYNTLKLFREKKLVRELVVDPSRVFYDPNTAPHHHFYDVESGRLTDIPADSVRIAELPQAPAGTQAEAVDVIIRTRPLRP